MGHDRYATFASSRAGAQAPARRQSPQRDNNGRSELDAAYRFLSSPVGGALFTSDSLRDTRFFTHKKELTDTELRHLTEPDSDHVVALVVANTEPRCERARRLVSSANKLPICDEALTRSFLRLRPDA